MRPFRDYEVLPAKGCGVIVFVIALLTQACSHVTEVQLFTQYLSDEDVQTIKALLPEKDFKVVPNKVKVPEGLYSTSLIYSPLNRQIVQVNRLMDILSSSEFGVPQLEITGKENHFYGRDTVGLYIVTADHHKQKSLSSIYAREYNGRCKTDDANLILNEDGEAILLRYLWDDINNSEITVQNKGQWHYRDHILFIAMNGNEPSEFEVIRREYSEEKSYREIRLKNNNTLPFYDDCDFIYRALID